MIEKMTRELYGNAKGMKNEQHENKTKQKKKTIEVLRFH